MSVYLILLANELKSFLRTKVALFWTFVFPVFFLTVMLLAFGGKEQLGVVGLDVQDNDKSAESVRFISSAHDFLTGTRTMRIDLRNSSNSEAPAKGHVAIRIAKSFGQALKAGDRAPVEIVYDFNGAIAVQTAAKMLYGFTIIYGATASGANLPLQPVLGNSGGTASALTFGQYIVAGVLIMAMMSTCIVTLAISIASLREQNSFKAFATMPIRPAIYIASMMSARILIVLTTAVLFLLAAKYAYGINADVFAIAGARALIVVFFAGVMFLSLGLAIGARSANIASATLITNLVYFPMLFLGDLTVPLNDFPSTIKSTLSIIPVHSVAVSLRDVLFLGKPISVEAGNLGAMALWAAVFATIAALRFRWHAEAR